MLYNDEETREFEERFEQYLAKASAFATNHKEDLEEITKVLLETLMPILQKEHKTPEDIALIQKFGPKVLQITQVMEDMQLLLGESLLRQSNAIYENAKKMAAEGDEEAMKVYEKLKPSYDAMMREQMDNNAN